MECPHFAGVVTKYCVAEREFYVPSIDEMSEYCKHIQHRGCRHFIRIDNDSVTKNNPDFCSDTTQTLP